MNQKNLSTLLSISIVLLLIVGVFGLLQSIQEVYNYYKLDLALRSVLLIHFSPIINILLISAGLGLIKKNRMAVYIFILGAFLYLTEGVLAPGGIWQLGYYSLFWSVLKLLFLILAIILVVNKNLLFKTALPGTASSPETIDFPRKKSLTYIRIANAVSWLPVFVLQIFILITDRRLGLAGFVVLIFLVGSVILGVIINVVLLSALKHQNYKFIRNSSAVIIALGLLFNGYWIISDFVIAPYQDKQRQEELDTGQDRLQEAEIFSDCTEIITSLEDDCLLKVFKLSEDFEGCLAYADSIENKERVDRYKHICIDSYVEISGDIEICQYLTELNILNRDDSISKCQDKARSISFVPALDEPVISEKEQVVFNNELDIENCKSMPQKDRLEIQDKAYCYKTAARVYNDESLCTISADLSTNSKLTKGLEPEEILVLGQAALDDCYTDIIIENDRKDLCDLIQTDIHRNGETIKAICAF
ncbi:hypothetical protein KKB10_03545 [Patescibacteria group bacterium]|nr:hypothetical protein [Patescibacteria group bacterium]MBU1951904.1 hypothetical protein [Patescibacteria group bacterium]